MTTEPDKPTPWRDIDWLARLADGLTFGASMRAFRKCEDWTLQDGAERIGISKQLLSEYETGKKLPSLEQAYRIAMALGMNPQSALRDVLNEQLSRIGLEGWSVDVHQRAS